MKIFFGTVTSIFVILLLFWGVYNFRFKHNASIPTISGGSIIQETSSLGALNPGGKNIAPILTERVLSATANDQHLLYFSLDEDAFRKSNLDGKNKETLLSHLPGTPLRISWSPSREKALVQLKQSGGLSPWYMADLTLKTLTPLKSEISRVIWDNTGSRIFYLYTDPQTKERTLNAASPDGSGWKNLITLGTKDFFLASVPSSILVSYWGRPRARDASSLSTISLTGTAPSVLISNQLGADFLWAPTGDKILMSSTDPHDPSRSKLTVTNESGGEQHVLENASTLINKTTWSKNGQTLYYALPGALPESTILPDDYFDKNLHSQDSFWKIDVTSNKAERLVDLKDLVESYDATNLFLSPREDTLLFIERKNQKLYSIDL